jgi:exodeoxyribonuclease V alpha subunit
MITLEGHLESITYYNEENHYTIARLRTRNTDNPVTVVGYMAEAVPGETLKIKGSWETHAKYGRQFKINSFEITLPSTIDGIKRYLKSGLIKGIGPKTADRMVRQFKDKTLEIIEDDPERLLEIEGIGKATASRIAKAWKGHHAVRSLMQFLQEHGVDTSYSAKIFQEYGRNAVKIISSNPFRLANDIPGTGFSIADTIALKSGTPKNEPERVKACLIHLTRQSSNDGHTFIYEDELLKRCTNLFQVDPDTAEDALKALADSGEVVIETVSSDQGAHAVYPKGLHEAETGVANKLKALLSVTVTSPNIDPDRITAEVLKKLAIKLSSEQLKVLDEILSHRVAIITGGPGTGKTTLIRSVNAVFEAIGRDILLAAPTGRAARRLSEVTHRKAATIHKLLGYNLTTGAFEKNQDTPLYADAVIIDEASMVDTSLMFHLLKAVPMTSVLIIVGDAFQLPSVGPGNVLSDMIESGVIPVFYLKKIYRQAQESPIVVNAHMVRRGKFPLPARPDKHKGLSEFYFIEQSNPGQVVETIVELCANRIPKRFNLDPVTEIQVLTPMHKGEVGVINLNKVLQQVLNTSPVLIKSMGNTFKEGDKVMHLKNNYQKEVFNGDIGTIRSIDEADNQLSVDYYGRTVTYDFDELNEISPAYAISVHKSQGSEYPAVIVPIMTQHFALLQRNLLYTAMTRGKMLVILIGTQNALNIALKNDKPRQRLSSLASRLKANE